MTVKKSTIIKVIISVLVLAAAVILIYDFSRGFNEPVVLIKGDELIIKSSGGVTVVRNEINSARLIDELPTLIRGKGFGFANVQRGGVKVNSLGAGLAYVNKSKGPPYIYLDLNKLNGNFLFLNLYDADDTRELYEHIQAWLQT
jgi:hypothetical protein